MLNKVKDIYRRISGRPEIRREGNYFVKGNIIQYSEEAKTLSCYDVNAIFIVTKVEEFTWADGYTLQTIKTYPKISDETILSKWFELALPANFIATKEGLKLYE